MHWKNSIFFSDLFILDHSVVTQTSHRYQEFRFGLRFQNDLTIVIMCRHSVCRDHNLSNDACLLNLLKIRNRMRSSLPKPI